MRSIFNRPAHPYTLALLEAVPKIDRRVQRLYAIPGVPASGYSEFAGCPFADRCAMVTDRCKAEKPPLVTVAPDHTAECWRAEELYASAGSVSLVEADANRGTASEGRP